MSITLTYDFEQLRQPFAQKTLAGATHFRAIRDVNSNPIIFAVHRDGYLLVLIQSENAQTQLINLSEQLGATETEKITAFTVSQSNELDTYIAFATTDGESASKLWILPKIEAPSGNFVKELTESSVFAQPAENDFIVSKLLLNSIDDGSGYPFLAAVYKAIGQNTQDVARVNVDVDSQAWSWATDLAFPFKIDEMTDYCVGAIPGVTGVASGIFGIDHTQHNPTLTFAGVSGPASNFQPRSPINVNLPIPANPKSVTTVLDEDGMTNVLVGGDDGILFIASQNCTESVPIGTIYPATLTDPNVAGAHKMEVAQNGSDFTLWALNGVNNLVWQTASVQLNGTQEFDELINIGAPVPLLPKGDQLESFDAVFNPKTGAHQVYCLRDDGSVSSLRQAGDSKLWSEQRLSIPDPKNVEDVNTYACHLRLKDENGNCLPDTTVTLTSSSQTTCTSNGGFFTLGATPTFVTSNSQGTIALVFPAPDLTTPSITVTAEGLEPVTFNPATKAMNKLVNTVNNGGLGQITNKNNQPLFPNISKQNSAAIAQLGQHYLAMTQAPPKAAPAPSFAKIDETLGGPIMRLGDGEDNGVVWNFFHWLLSGAEEILSFGFDIISDVGTFILQTAEKAWTFIVDTAERALKALSGVLKVIGAVVEDVIVWLAELIDWESIKDTMTVFEEFWHTGVDLIQYALVEGEEIVDDTFEMIETVVGNWHTPPILPEEIADSKPDTESKDDTPAYTDNPVYNWANGHIDNGNSKDVMAQANAEADKTNFTDVLEGIWSDLLAPLWDNFKDTLENVWEDIKAIFDKNSGLTWKDAFKNIGTDLLLGIVRAIKEAIKGLMKVAGKFVDFLNNIITQRLDIWVISQVYEREFGKPLTMLGVCSLILAVPTTYLFKLLFGKSPREVPQIAQLLDNIKNNTWPTEAPKVQVPQANATLFVQLNGRGTPESDELLAEPLDDDTEVEATEVVNEKSLLLLQKDSGLRGPRVGDGTGEEPIIDTDKLLENPKVSKWKYIERCGSLIVAIGKLAYCVYDTISTGLTWPKMGPNIVNNLTPEDKKPTWKQAFGYFMAVGLTVAAFPFSKLDRNAAGKTTRILTWFFVGCCNILKAGLPTVLKPALVTTSAYFEFIGYAITLIVEGSDGDTPLEWSHRLLTSGWTIGSGYNCATGAMEPYGLGATIVIGVAVNVQAGVLTFKQAEYFKENGWNENYYPPSWETSLNGSLV